MAVARLRNRCQASPARSAHALHQQNPGHRTPSHPHRLLRTCRSRHRARAQRWWTGHPCCLDILNPMLCLLAGFAIVFALFCVWTLSLYLSFARADRAAGTVHRAAGMLQGVHRHYRSTVCRSTAPWPAASIALVYRAPHYCAHRPNLSPLQWWCFSAPERR